MPGFNCIATVFAFPPHVIRYSQSGQIELNNIWSNNNNNNYFYDYVYWHSNMRQSPTTTLLTWQDIRISVQLLKINCCGGPNERFQCKNISWFGPLVSAILNTDFRPAINGFFVQRAVSCVSKFYISFPLLNDKNPACEVCEPLSYSRKIWQISARRSLNVFNDSSYRVFFALPCLWSLASTLQSWIHNTNGKCL